MKKRVFAWIVLMVCGVLTMQAQGVSRLDVELRSDWQYEALKGVSQPSVSGFDGKFFNLRMDGSIAENLSYSIRYRANKVQSSPFAATDWQRSPTRPIGGTSRQANRWWQLVVTSMIVRLLISIMPRSIGIRLLAISSV